MRSKTLQKEIFDFGGLAIGFSVVLLTVLLVASSRADGVSHSGLLPAPDGPQEANCNAEVAAVLAAIQDVASAQAALAAAEAALAECEDASEQVEEFFSNNPFRAAATHSILER